MTTRARRELFRAVSSRLRACSTAAVALLLVAAGAGAAASASAGAGAGAGKTTGAREGEAEPARVAAARKAQGAEVARMLAAAGVPAPRALLLRVFKEEKQLELWAGPEASAPLRLLRTFPICRSSGRPGPKLSEGDGQVPEGFYEVSQLNPWSQFHLSLKVSYPNAADRARAHGARTGGDIFIHGDCVTIGCVPLGDAAIELVYLAALDAKARGARVAVHLFPARMQGPAWEAQAAAAPAALRAFWAELQPAQARFDNDHLLPKVRIDNGHYRLE